MEKINKGRKMKPKYYEIKEHDHKEVVKGQLIQLFKQNWGDSFDKLWQDFMACGRCISLNIGDSLTLNYCIEEDRILYKTTATFPEEGQLGLFEISKDLYDMLVDEDEE
jgi:hypothetical protein